MIKEIKKRKKLLSTVVILLVVCSMFMIVIRTPDVKATWWNSDWGYKKEIIINHNQIDSTLTNFPICINITDTGLRDNAQNDGDDIVFTDNTEVTHLNHEIEYYDGATGRLVAWVNVTSISHSSNTSIFMYYGNAAASNQENVTDTWHTNYDCVYHMKMDVNSNLSDSTANDKDLYYWGSPTQVNNVGKHKLGYAISFDGLDDAPSDCFEVVTTYADDLTVLFDLTLDSASATENDIFAFYKTDRNFGRIDSGTSMRLVAKDINGQKIQLSTYKDGVYGYRIDEGSDFKTWHEGGYRHSESYATTVTEGDSGSMIGAGSNKHWAWDGYIDEFRISAYAWSVDYIVAEHNSIVNATDGGFFSMQTEEAGATSPSSSTMHLPNNKFTHQGETGNITLSNETSTTYETANISFVYNGTQTIDYVRINVSDIHANITSDNIYLQFTSDNSSWNKGGTWKTGASGGWSFIINATTWTNGNGCYGSSMFPVNDNTSYIFFRTKIIIPSNIGNETYSKLDMTWDYGYYT